MLRLLHTADVHLGARNESLGEAAAVLRERQHGALRVTVDLALAERVDAVLIAGNLFAANAVSRRTVERAAVELGRLAAGRIRVVVVPGGHDAYTRSSVYRAYDLPALAGAEMLTLLTPERPWVRLDSLDALVACPFDAAERAVADPRPAGTPAATWRIGLLPMPVGDGPEAIAPAALAALGVDFAALGGAPLADTGRAGSVTWAVPGAPEQVVADRDAPGTVNLVTLEEGSGGRKVTVEARTVGTTTRRLVDVDAAGIESPAALVDRLRAAGNPDVVLDVRITGERPDSLELEPRLVEAALRDAYLCVRVDDRSRPPLTPEPLLPLETVGGAFIRSVERQLSELEATGAATDEAAELRTVLRTGRRLLAGEELAW